MRVKPSLSTPGCSHPEVIPPVTEKNRSFTFFVSPFLTLDYDKFHLIWGGMEGWQVIDINYIIINISQMFLVENSHLTFPDKCEKLTLTQRLGK